MYIYISSGRNLILLNQKWRSLNRCDFYGPFRSKRDKGNDFTKWSVGILKYVTTSGLLNTEHATRNIMKMQFYYVPQIDIN